MQERPIRTSNPESPSDPDSHGERAEAVRVVGRVQGVGFRQTVRELAQRFALRGWVANDPVGTVSLQVCGRAGDVDAFVSALTSEAPPLARIDRIERKPIGTLPPGAGFRIVRR